MYAANSTGATDSPSDQAVVRDLGTGAVMATFDIVDESMPPRVMCGGIVSHDRVVACGFRGDVDRVGTAVIATADGRSVAQRSLQDTPVLDRATQVVAMPVAGGAIEALGAVDGNLRWVWSAAQVAQGQVTLRHPREGHFIGDAGRTNLVVNASTGDLELVEAFYFLPDGQVPTGRVLVALESKIVAFGGPGVAVGAAHDDPATVLFVRN